VAGAGSQGKLSSSLRGGKSTKSKLVAGRRKKKLCLLLRGKESSPEREGGQRLAHTEKERKEIAVLSPAEGGGGRKASNSKKGEIRQLFAIERGEKILLLRPVFVRKKGGERKKPEDKTGSAVLSSAKERRGGEVMSFPGKDLERRDHTQRRGKEDSSPIPPEKGKGLCRRGGGKKAFAEKKKRWRALPLLP